MDAAASRLADAAEAAADAAGPPPQRSQRSSSGAGRSGRSSGSSSSGSGSGGGVGVATGSPPRPSLPSAAAQFRAAQAATSTPSVRPPPPPLPKPQRFADLRWVSQRSHSARHKDTGRARGMWVQPTPTCTGTRRRSSCRGCCGPVIGTVAVSDSRGRSDDGTARSLSARRGTHDDTHSRVVQ
jgi:hypothetical protein